MNNRRTRGKSRQTSDAPAAVGQRIELALERLTHDGRGIGRWQGRTVFVEGGMPGEQVVARVVRARSKLIEARLERLILASPERQAPACQHVDLCGGCSLQHMSQQTQLQIKQQALAQQLEHFAGLQPEHWMPALSGAQYGYRQRSRLSVRWDHKTRQLQVGFRQRASKALVEVTQCPVLVPELERLLQELPAELQQLQGCATLGHVELMGGEQPAMIVRHLQPLSESDIQRLRVLAQRHDMVCYLQSGNEASLHSLTDGTTQPSYRLPDQQLAFHFAVGDFTQVNPEINQQMVNQALDWLAVQPGERVLDLFCGIGNFSLPLAQAGAVVTGVEGSAEMVERAAANAHFNHVQQVHFLQTDLSNSLEPEWLNSEYQAALLDPPRDGAAEITAMLARKRVQRILYVSCNPATLARDAGILSAAGYRLAQVGVMDMFPQTAHVEAMALFVSGKDKK